MSDFSRFQPNADYGGQDGREKELGYDPKFDDTDHYASTAVMLGIAAIACNFFAPIVLPLVLGSLSIILAVLSKGKRMRFPDTAKRALIFAVTALVLDVFITISSVFSILSAMQDPIRREQIDSTLNQLYGTTIEEILQSIDSIYGTNLYERFIGDDAESGENSSADSTEGSSEESTEDSSEGATEEIEVLPGTPEVAMMPEVLKIYQDREVEYEHA